MWIWDHQVCEYTMDFLDVANELNELKWCPQGIAQP
jgi:hypothetical protein